ncbi:OmpH family outer membrane protein [uncultured Lacinutrix sp.]|uniref:OmpH family outer membrane protein n=1 Tax=uncultured Lacinutrix sp. TaxID=574032 RepID=UPI00261D14E3|nr:OmpH family outer membrane protein [uncultured Lacinutrix sp.]
MKKLILAIVTVAAFSSCQQQKIGYVDNGEVINEIQEKKDIESKYTLLDESFKKRADSIGNIYRGQFQALQAKSARLSQAKQQEMMQPLQIKAQQFQQQMQAEQQQMQKAYQVEIDSVISNMKSFVKDYGKTNGYDYILGTNESIGTVLFAKEGTDLSKKIIEEINTQYKK